MKAYLIAGLITAGIVFLCSSIVFSGAYLYEKHSGGVGKKINIYCYEIEHDGVVYIVNRNGGIIKK